LQIRRENMDTIVAPVLKEVDYRISKSSSTKSYHEAPRIPFRSSRVEAKVFSSD